MSMIWPGSDKRGSTTVSDIKVEVAKIGLSISQDKTEYLDMCRYKNTKQKREDLVVGDSIFKGVAKFRYLGCTATDTYNREDKGIG